MSLAVAFCAASVFAAPRGALAQQSFFNVPATVRTHDRALFGQVQANVMDHAGEVNTTLELGLGGRFEVGMNLFHLSLYERGTGGETARDLIMVNGTALFELGASLMLQIGLAGGAGRSPVTDDEEPAAFGWATLRWDAPGRWGAWVIGANAGTHSAVGEGFPVAGLAAVEVPIIDDRLSAQADWVIGTNEQSVAVVGLVALVSDDFQIAAGAQLPSPGSQNSFGGVLELTWVPAIPGGPRVHPGLVPR